MKIKIEDIRDPAPGQPPEGEISRLKLSITELGLINPITVRKDTMQLVAGRHRLLACKELGWEEIEANVIDLSDARAEMATIDENLCRKHSNQVEIGQMVARRKELYLIEHPETAQHVAGGAAKAAKDARAPGALAQSFVADTAAIQGVSESAVKRQVRIGEGLAPQVAEAVKHLPIAQSPSKLDQLARLDPEEQEEAVERISEPKKFEEQFQREHGRKPSYAETLLGRPVQKESDVPPPAPPPAPPAKPEQQERAERALDNILAGRAESEPPAAPPPAPPPARPSADAPPPAKTEVEPEVAMAALRDRLERELRQKLYEISSQTDFEGEDLDRMWDEVLTMQGR